MTSSAPTPPRVGVGLFLFPPPTHSNANHFLLGERLGSLGANTFALPGGHLEFGESFEECAAREAEEETGLKVRDLRFLTATNSVMDGGKHYVTVFMVGVVDEEGGRKAEPETRERDKCAGWEWVRWEDVVGWASKGAGGEDGGRRLFQPMRDLVEQRSETTPRPSVVVSG
ncbi:uncharacterized protein HMPREF1541_01997 [Cyphellophora europaea CBS 101466]|uniref:Nudix hydrolase domain-containing protein n=1 Tax=Cyphellophora europaea (strain CBS 101466) TaxID=1220924 RepID=W2S4F1_CYPE1|nr:uncharacterized protein HMPREF1541_01997 [Cyphellophora europaea CBS 101466]ETN42839.1 hypothetical protein HMPREF1541_01997 [Cyphellophora europaea CBS 101466]